MSAFLDQLIDEVGNDDRHPLARLMDTVGTLIEAYDKENFPFSEGDPIGVLKYLMANHNLTQSDLLELDSQGVISERGTKRETGLKSGVFIFIMVFYLPRSGFVQRDAGAGPEYSLKSNKPACVFYKRVLFRTGFITHLMPD